MQHVWRDISTWTWADCTLPFCVTLVDSFTQLHHSLSILCLFLKWCLPHKETTVQLPRDAGEHLHASVWGYSPPRQPSRVAPLPSARTKSLLCIYEYLTLFHNWSVSSQFYGSAPGLSCRLWVLTVWMMSQNQSNISSTWTVHCQSTGQRRTTHPTPTTSTICMQTWLCWTTCAGL